ncbi:MAG: ribonuclease H-like domain-containing protein [Candidatus Lokiarchaeota archaeon]|nr:ribonuclease H-like domain-containing protein [Candidatus Lokiarchaeota archaeon]
MNKCSPLGEDQMTEVPNDDINISYFLEKYRGKKIEEIYPNNKILQNQMGSFLQFRWQKKIDDNLQLKQTRKNLLYKLETISNIGNKTEKSLRNKGINTIKDLKYHLGFQSPANEILNQIENKDFEKLLKHDNIYDLDLLFCFQKKDLLFIDIETLGLYFQPIIMVGIGFFNQSNFDVRVCFAREFEEEISICEYLRSKIFPNFKCLISYNGKSFDIPFIKNRFRYYFDEDPISDYNECSFLANSLLFHHVDLYHNCRRLFKNEINRFSLTNVEQKLLKIYRKGDINGSVIGKYYRKYLENPRNNGGLMKYCIEHNYFDIISMPLILQKMINT